MNKIRQVYIKTFGCQMNLRDSEVIAGLLKGEGFTLVDAPEKADIVLFNTCSVRQHAEDKVWSEIGRICKGPRAQRQEKQGTNSEGRRTKDEGRKGVKPLIGIVGCMAQNYKEQVFERSPLVDFVVGPSDIHKIPEIIKKVAGFRFQVSKAKRGQSPKGGDSHLFGKSLFESKIWETDGQIRPDEVYHTGFYDDKEHAFVVISEGCSNYCSYCVVPYVRGELHHRDHQAVLKEIEEAIDRGITRITLLGQNVNAYQSTVDSPCLAGRQARSTVNFIELLKLVNNIEGLKEFSFIASHPKDTSVELFKAMARLEKLKKYLHLPVQSGSDRILKLMNRNYTRKFYLDLADNYRKIVKGGVLTTDIILGFPTETEDDFLDTYNLVKGIGFDSAFIFKYSVRPHTEASNMPDDVPKEEKERRHSLILELQKNISRKLNIKNQMTNQISKSEEQKRRHKRKFKRFIFNFWILLCIFDFWILIFGFNCNAYALNLDRVKISFISGDYKTAISEGESILAKTNNSSLGLDELYYFLGLSYMKTGNYLRASDIFEIIGNEFKKSLLLEDAALSLGDTFFLRNDYAQAEKRYQELLNNNLSTRLKSALYYRLSRCAAKLDKPEIEKDYLLKLKQEFPLSRESGFEGDKCTVNAVNLNGEYAVQVGYFSNDINAGNLLSELTKKGYPAYTEKDDASGKQVYRVKVGKSASRGEIEAIEAKLSKDGYPTKICP